MATVDHQIVQACVETVPLVADGGQLNRVGRSRKTEKKSAEEGCGSLRCFKSNSEMEKRPRLIGLAASVREFLCEASSP